jgi:hypothetical protein
LASGSFVKPKPLEEIMEKTAWTMPEKVAVTAAVIQGIAVLAFIVYVAGSVAGFWI